MYTKSSTVVCEISEIGQFGESWFDERWLYESWIYDSFEKLFYIQTKQVIIETGVYSMPEHKNLSTIHTFSPEVNARVAD